MHDLIERRIRIWLGLFIAALVLSGLSAFPLEWETRWLVQVVADPHLPFAGRWPALVDWVQRVHGGLADTYARYPFFGYGTDWLAFAHLVIGIAFWGPWRQPVRNAWVVDWGIIACAGIVPLALICGEVRGIPLFWRAIDMSFGVFGVVPLLRVRHLIRELERWPQ